MADDRYGGYGRREAWRDREGSIFSDDDDDRRSQGPGRWTGNYSRERSGAHDDDRGFLERAGDEVRSWFGDEEAERRRERNSSRDDARAGFGGPGHEGRNEATGRGTSYAGSFTSPEYDLGRASLNRDFSRDEAAGYGQRSVGRGPSRSLWDDNYRRWRDQQIRQFDSEYEDYCRERQKQFEQDFDSWRSSRLTEGGIAGGVSERMTAEATGTAGTASETAKPAGETDEVARGRGTRTRT